MNLFKLFALSLAALPSVASGMKIAKPSFDSVAFEALLKNKGDSNVALSDAQVEYLRGIQSSIKEYEPSTKITGPRFNLGDQFLGGVFCPKKENGKCVSIFSGSQNVVPCADHYVTLGGELYSLTLIGSGHREQIRTHIADGILKKTDLEYILSHERVGRLASLRTEYDRTGKKIIGLTALFSNQDPRIKTMDTYVIGETSIPLKPWYRRPTVWAAAVAIVGLGGSYLYRDSLAEMVQNPALAISKAQSLWSGIKGVFSR